jgi:hypothetical protein
MNIVDFKFKYYKQCIDIIFDTWKLIGNCVGKRLNKNKIFHHRYFLMSLLLCDYKKIVIDSNGNVFGYLLGRTKPINKVNKQIMVPKFLIDVVVFINGLIGFLGNSIRVGLKEIYDEYVDYEKHLYKNCVYDSTIELFIIKKELKNKGIGRLLYYDYENFLKSNNKKKCLLWTTPSCDYQAYEKFGFELIKNENIKNNSTVYVYLKNL